MSKLSHGRGSSRNEIQEYGHWIMRNGDRGGGQSPVQVGVDEFLPHASRMLFVEVSRLFKQAGRL